MHKERPAREALKNRKSIHAHNVISISMHLNATMAVKFQSHPFFAHSGVLVHPPRKQQKKGESNFFPAGFPYKIVVRALYLYVAVLRRVTAFFLPQPLHQNLIQRTFPIANPRKHACEPITTSFGSKGGRNGRTARSELRIGTRSFS